MPHEWILDVLHDLQAYSRQNDLPRLGEELDRLIATARVEIGAGAAERAGAAGMAASGRHAPLREA